MIWFRHLSKAGRSEKLMLVKDEFGMAGYGAYWSILEAIAEKMDGKSDRCHLALSVKNWRKITDFSPKKLQKYFTFLQKVGLFLQKNNGNTILLSCPKLLELRDEYTKKKLGKSGHAPDKLPQNANSVSASEYNYQLPTTNKHITTTREGNDFYIDPVTGEEVAIP